MTDYTDQTLFTRIPADLSGQKDRKGTYARRAQPELPPLGIGIGEEEFGEAFDTFWEVAIERKPLTGGPTSIPEPPTISVSPCVQHSWTMSLGAGKMICIKCGRLSP